MSAYDFLQEQANVEVAVNYLLEKKQGNLLQSFLSSGDNGPECFMEHDDTDGHKEGLNFRIETNGDICLQMIPRPLDSYPLFNNTLRYRTEMGGGKYQRTRRALLLLGVAIQRDVSKLKSQEDKDFYKHTEKREKICLDYLLEADRAALIKLFTSIDNCFIEYNDSNNYNRTLKVMIGPDSDLHLRIKVMSDSIINASDLGELLKKDVKYIVPFDSMFVRVRRALIVMGIAMKRDLANHHNYRK